MAFGSWQTYAALWLHLAAGKVSDWMYNSTEGNPGGSHEEIWGYAGRGYGGDVRSNTRRRQRVDKPRAEWRRHLALAVSPKNSGTVYAGTRGGVFRSTDGGTNWTSVRPGFTPLVAVDPQDPSTVYAVDYFGGGRLFKSRTADRVGMR
jgi:hypothetical protein